MQTTLFEVKFYNGSKFNVFCSGKSQIKRFLLYIHRNVEEIESWRELTNGIHKISQLEKISALYH